MSTYSLRLDHKNFSSNVAKKTIFYIHVHQHEIGSIKIRNVMTHHQ